ncbi:hypothetical protein DFQ29_009089 [Apophysomyces sp. BC1021]|nr:hypothetical protein DFQ29_009089 [Apophysomyces sp. BC1021]
MVIVIDYPRQGIQRVHLAKHIVDMVDCVDEYFVSDSEWADGSRSDLVLKPKLIEFQNRIDYTFCKRAISYCLQASKRYQRDPIIIIFGTNIMSLETTQMVEKGRMDGTYTLLSLVRAKECVIVNKASLDDVTYAHNPLDPFLALGRFLTAGQLVTPYDDPTMESLRSLTNNHINDMLGQVHPLDTLTKIINDNDHEYNELLDMISNGLWEDGKKKVQGQKAATEHLRRKFLIDDNPLTTSNCVAATASSHEKAMSFVVDFKVAGHGRMDWVACWREGIDKKLFSYKTAKSLQTPI